jgi:hypothetical protein
MSDLFRKFKEHPADVGMTYREHFRFAMKLAGANFKAAFASVIHACFPFLLKRTTSATIFKQYNLLSDRKPDNLINKNNRHE